MAENEYVHPENGAEVREQDIDLMSHDGAVADDRTLWEFLRLTHGAASPQKAVLPYGKSGWHPDLGPDNATPLDSTALVQGNAANGSVYVLPFRAVVGSTTASPTFDVEYLRGQRSFYLLGATWHGRTVAVAANASGNPRWDLVYASISPDAAGDAANYVKKDPGTLLVSLVVAGTVTKKTTVTVSILSGTPAASPTKPATPADGGGVYKIPLAYLWIPNGFNGSSAVTRSAIYEVAPCIPIHSSTGTTATSPADQQNKVGGTVDANQSVPSNGSIQNGAYLPPTMVGGEKRLILLQLGTSPVSHTDGQVVDTSVDWRFRYFRWTSHVAAGTNGNVVFASDRNHTPSTPCMSSANTISDAGCGQSFVDDNSTTIVVANGNGAAYFADFGSGNRVMVYVRNTDGALVFKQTGSNLIQLFVWLEATGPYSNFGTV